MTLSQMADYVTAKVGQTDAQSVAICKTFIRRRNQMIWDFATWADSLALITVLSGSVMFSEIDFPVSVERVINLRNVTTNSPVLGVSIGTIFDFDSSIFAQTGQPLKFVHLPARPEAFATGVGHLTFDAEDVLGQDVAILNVVGGDGAGNILRETVTVVIDASAQTTTLDFTGKVGSDFDNGGFGRYFIAYADATTTVAVALVPTGSFAPGGTGTDALVQIDIGPAYNAAQIAAACEAANGSLSPYFSAVASGNTATFTVNVAGPLTNSVDVNTGVPVTNHTGAVGPQTTTTSDFDELYYISSDLSQQSIPMLNEDGDSIGDFSGDLYPSDADTALPYLERIQMIPLPAQQQTCLAEVKLKCATLANDSDHPALRGIDNVLLAFAQADMLQRQRQYAKSQALMQEAQGQLQIMLDLEKNQQAFDSCVIPAQVNTDAYYDDFYGRLKNGYF